MDGKKTPKLGSGQIKLPTLGSSKLSKVGKLPQLSSKSPAPQKDEPKPEEQPQHPDETAAEKLTESKSTDGFKRSDDEPTDVVSTNDLLNAVSEMEAWDSIPSTNAVPSEIGHFSSIEMPKTTDDKPDVAKEVLSAEATISAPMEAYHDPNANPDVAKEVLSAEATISAPVDTYEKQSEDVPVPETVPSDAHSDDSSDEQTESPAPSPVPPAAPPVAAQAPIPPAAPQIPSPAQQPAPPAQPEPQVEAQAEMTEEEQLEAYLAQMSPAERAEYEAYSAQQRLLEAQQERERQREKQREMMEMYNASAAEAAKNKAPIGLIVAIVILCIGFVGVIYHFVTSEDEKPETTETAAAEEAKPDQPKQIRANPLNTYPVQINRGNADDVFVNGVMLSGNTAQFATGHRNTVIAYANGMVPYFNTFDKGTEVTAPVDIKLVSDTLYSKGQFRFQLLDPGITEGSLRVTFDGRVVGNFPGAITDVVLGMPHILTIEKPGYAKHMHIIWGKSVDNEVKIPPLKKENEVVSGTDCSLKEFPVSDKPYGIRVDAAGQTFSGANVVTLQYGDIIEYYITREQRKTLQISVIPDGFGTMQMDPVLLHESIGESILTFTNAKNSDMQVCMRRVGELICPDMKGETTVPSGEWEFFGYEGDSFSPRIIRGGQMQNLSSKRKYSFEASRDNKGNFDMNLKDRIILKDNDKK